MGELDEKQPYSLTYCLHFLETHGAWWDTRCSVHVQILLARLLALMSWNDSYSNGIYQLAQVFVQSGFNTALIQKKDADEDDFSSIFS